MAASLSSERQLQIHQSERQWQIREAVLKTKRMLVARFYFKSSEYYQQDLPDTRSCSEYLKILEDNGKSSDKKKIRQAICRIWRCIYEEIEFELHLTQEEKIFFLINYCDTMEEVFRYVLCESGITRWPRIYVDDSKYNGNVDSLILEVIPERYIKDGVTISEMDCNVEPKFEVVDYKGHPANKFSYNSGQINLSSVRNSTAEIERSIMNELSKENLFKNRSSNGFSVHHIIPRKKLEIFRKLRQRLLTRAAVHSTTLLPHGLAGARAVERIYQGLRVSQLYKQFRDKGLMTTIKSCNKQTCDSGLSPTGNIFYGPQQRSDDEQNGFRVDKAAALVLSEEEYEAIIFLDDELNEFFDSIGLRMTELSRSATIDRTIAQLMDEAYCRGFSVLVEYDEETMRLDMLIRCTFGNIGQNHGLTKNLEPIKFDPRLVDRDEVTGESKWFYRHRKIVEKSLPNWYQTILRNVSQKLKVPLEIDLNLFPADDAKNGVDGNQSRQPLLRIQPLDYISNGREIYVIIWEDLFVADLRVIYKFSETVLDLNGPRD